MRRVGQETHATAGQEAGATGGFLVGRRCCGWSADFRVVSRVGDRFAAVASWQVRGLFLPRSVREEQRRHAAIHDDLSPSDEASLRTAEKCDDLCDVTRRSKSSEGMEF